jgi:EAL domain-containing protein (putative c-di-GMP-specific phosphodiesterase class I)
MLRDADTALYRSKASGRGRYEIFDAAMRQEVLRTVETEADLRHAIEEGGFLLHYQPIVEIACGRVAGLEALLRWQHPRRGMVMPNDFIPIAEETGLIVPIGYWVVAEVCRQILEWDVQRSGDRPVVAINVSRRQLQMGDFARRVIAIVDQYGVPHDALEFELTESVVMSEPEDVRAAIEALKSAGFRISIDDFGTGYSSLSTLQRLPVDRLKLDRSFLEDVQGDSEARQVMEGIMLLADHLRLEVVAEGIETQQHLRRVRGMNCPYGQGYLFSRPGPPGPNSLRDLPGSWGEADATQKKDAEGGGTARPTEASGDLTGVGTGERYKVSSDGRCDSRA